MKARDANAQTMTTPRPARPFRSRATAISQPDPPRQPCERPMTMTTHTEATPPTMATPDHDKALEAVNSRMGVTSGDAVTVATLHDNPGA